jgi:MoxR-like ATPase
MHARVVNGKWVLDDPSGLPEGTVVEIVTRSVTPEIYIDDKIREYIHAIVVAANATTRPGVDRELVDHAKAIATRDKRGYVTPHDVKLAAPEVLGRSERVAQILDTTPVP